VDKVEPVAVVGAAVGVLAVAAGVPVGLGVMAARGVWVLCSGRGLRSHFPPPLNNRNR
jgi:hypothetical protein